MTLYVVEHRLLDVGEGHLEALREALHEITRRLDDVTGGERVTYLRSTVVNGGERCICAFDATSEAIVRRANELAQVPIAWIGTATDHDFTGREAER